jgi:hypothetical protein
MAARRLIAVMLVLLFLSSLAAALAPVERGEDTSTTSTDPVTEAVEVPSGDLVRATLRHRPGEPPQRIPASVGDQLQLRVTSNRVATVELVGLGPTEDVDPLAPALFDVLLEDEGRFPVRELGESGRTLGVIVVSPRAPTEPAPDQARSRS